MLLIQSSDERTVRNWSARLAILFAVTGALALFMTMHLYVRPRPPAPPGFRLFGFPRPRG